MCMYNTWYGKCLIFSIAICAIVTVAQSLHAAWPANGVPVCVDAADQQSPQIVTDGAGGAIIMWVDMRNGQTDLYVQRIDGEGNALWTPDGKPVVYPTEPQEEAQMVSDGAEGVLITWRIDQAATHGDIFAQKIDSNGNGLWSLGGVPVCTNDYVQLRPRIASDGAGGAIIVWEDLRDDYQYKAYAQRLDASGAPLWIADGIPLCPDSTGQQYLQITPDGSGGAIVAWEDWRSGTESNIYAQRVYSNGFLLWGSSGVAVCTADYNQPRPRGCSDGSQGAILAWWDYRDFPFRSIYAQRIDASGTTRWTTNGVGVVDYGGSHNAFCIGSDGSGGAIIVFDDLHDIMAQRFDPNGIRLWTDNGATICNLGSNQTSPHLTPDGAGGAIFTWDDDRSGNQDIYAQHLDGDGVERWVTNGVPLCDTTEHQRVPRIVSDGTGYAICTWQDSRTGTNWDIYAQHQSYVATGVMPEVPEAFFLAQNFPNPFNPQTVIRFGLAEPGHVSLRVYDIAGRLVRVLVDEDREAGAHDEIWNGFGSNGRAVASGIYFYKLEAGTFIRTKKMVLMK
ncbi:MAG: T9SS type A sorting domain-containing protein [bacterium]|nr:MAG: T9SS type A sorting domain-containing protein [bacterium]